MISGTFFETVRKNGFNYLSVFLFAWKSPFFHCRKISPAGALNKPNSDDPQDNDKYWKALVF